MGILHSVDLADTITITMLTQHGKEIIICYCNRLLNIYLKRKSWGDAKAIFAKACELINNSPLAWLGLGISGLRYGEYKEAEEALTQSNIYDPFNYLTWGYLSLLCLKDGNRYY